MSLRSLRPSCLILSKRGVGQTMPPVRAAPYERVTSREQTERLKLMRAKVRRTQCGLQETLAYQIEQLELQPEALGRMKTPSRPPSRRKRASHDRLQAAGRKSAPDCLERDERVHQPFGECGCDSLQPSNTTARSCSAVLASGLSSHETCPLRHRNGTGRIRRDGPWHFMNRLGILVVLTNIAHWLAM